MSEQFTFKAIELGITDEERHQMLEEVLSPEIKDEEWRGNKYRGCVGLPVFGDLVNEDDEIEEQFVIGGGKSFLINIFENLRNMIIDLTGLNETISNIVTIIIILLLVYLLLKNFNLI